MNFNERSAFLTKLREGISELAYQNGVVAMVAVQREKGQGGVVIPGLEGYRLTFNEENNMFDVVEENTRAHILSTCPIPMCKAPWNVLMGCSAHNFDLNYTDIGAGTSIQATGLYRIPSTTDIIRLIIQDLGMSLKTPLEIVTEIGYTPFVSSVFNVSVTRPYRQSRSLRFQTIDTNEVFYTCANLDCMGRAEGDTKLWDEYYCSVKCKTANFACVPGTIESQRDQVRKDIHGYFVNEIKGMEELKKQLYIQLYSYGEDGYMIIKDKKKYIVTLYPEFRMTIFYYTNVEMSFNVCPGLYCLKTIKSKQKMCQKCEGILDIKRLVENTSYNSSKQNAIPPVHE